MYMTTQELFIPMYYLSIRNYKHYLGKKIFPKRDIVQISKYIFLL